ncbi:hypothetical protein N7456_010829 [Penicillium angulare]|uniref:BTB domain-containing protein n=1 Tax=Penicillium angulare TaxID=116970 RepID=A0A9W9ESK2_9EURO|nr:hypothetical protein N7456_010829 [Penicillium angulare]
MDLATRILDPDGEVTIILRHAKLSQADEAIQESSESSETSDDTPVGEQHSPVEQPNAEMATGQQPEPEVQEFRYQVSAKHLTFASPVFKRLLTGGWKESTIYSENVYVEITASDWDDEAFAILLRVIHGQYHEVPQKVTLHMLAEIGVIADYYDCKQALLIMIDMWVNALEEKMPSDYSVTTMRWIWVSWYFNLPKNFQESTSVAMASSTGVIDKCDFPIPDKVIGK